MSSGQVFSPYKMKLDTWNKKRKAHNLQLWYWQKASLRCRPDSQLVKKLLVTLRQLLIAVMKSEKDKNGFWLVWQKVPK